MCERRRNRFGHLAPLTISVADGVAVAGHHSHWCPGIRLRVVGSELHDAMRKPDELCAGRDEPPPPTAAAEHGGGGRHDVTLKSTPGIGRVNLAVLLAGVSRLSAAAITWRSGPCRGVAPVTKQSGKSCVVVKRNAVQVHDPRSCNRYGAYFVTRAVRCARHGG